MKKVICLFTICILFAKINCLQAQQFEWVKPIGSFVVGNSIGMEDSKVDNLGNNYILGGFSGTHDFDPGVGIFNMTSTASNMNIFLVKLDANGNFIWAVKYNSTGNLLNNRITIDNQQNVIISGNLNGTCDFDPGAGVSNVTAVGSVAYFTKLNASGTFLWNHTLVNTSATSRMTTDINRNIYMTGTFKDTVDFDPGVGVFNLVSQYSAIYILKWDENGNFGLAKSFQSTALFGANLNRGIDIAVDGQLNIYSVGTFASQNLDFDPGAGVVNLNGNGNNSTTTYISKLDSLGNFVWAKSFSSYLGGDKPANIQLDASTGNVITVGTFRNTLDFDPSSAYFTLSAAIGSGTYDVYISCLDSNGNFVYAKSLLGSGDESVNGIAMDEQNNVYIAGNFVLSGFSVGLNSSTSNNSLNNFNMQNEDVYILKFTNTGQFVWAKSIGGVSPQKASGLGYHNQSIYCHGVFAGATDFDPNQPVYNLTTPASAWNNQFTLKLGTCNVYSGALINLSDCDTVVYNNISYTASGVYYQQLSNSLGCDSFINLNIAIQNSTPSIIGQYATACNNYTFNNQILTQSGIYYDTLLNIYGCDSVITLNLTINNVNSTITQSNNLLSANANNATYQWITCNPTTVINGANAQTYTATSNGDYAVIVTQNGCTDTSNCITLLSVGLNNLDGNSTIQLIPNPAHDFLEVRSESGDLKNANIKMYNAIGQLVYSSLASNPKSNISNLKSNISIDISSFTNGIYFVEIKDDGKIFRTTIIKSVKN